MVTNIFQGSECNRRATNLSGSNKHIPRATNIFQGQQTYSKDNKLIPRATNIFQGEQTYSMCFKHILGANNFYQGTKHVAAKLTGEVKIVEVS